MSAFHRSTLGAFGTLFCADLRGYVGTTTDEVLSLSWPEVPTLEWAKSTAQHNAETLDRAESELAAWREEWPC